MKLSIIGTGYVGLVTGTCFAEMGHNVTCIDIDAAKVERMKKGECPIFEPGLEPLMQSNYEEGRLQFSNNYESVTKADAVFLAVGTPASDDGQADLKYVFGACDSIIPFLKEGAVVVVKSTVPVGTGHKVR
jgi:UDPglucose 6-dehydrogenase